MTAPGDPAPTIVYGSPRRPVTFRHATSFTRSVCSGGQRGEEALPRGAYRNSVERARERGVTTIAFPSISTGVYLYPIDEASRVALDEIVKTISKQALHREGLEEVRFVLFSSQDHENLPNSAQRGRMTDTHNLAVPNLWRPLGLV